MHFLADFIQKLSPRQIVSLGFGFILILFLAEYFYSFETVNLSLLFLMPIAFIAWYGSRNWSFTAALVCALKWLVSSLIFSHVDVHPIILIWNSFVRFAFYIIIIYILSMLKTTLRIQTELSNHDPLTNVFNTRAFYRITAQEKERARRYQHPLTICFIDVDDFKLINDQFGHSTGDMLLKIVADTIAKNIRSMDIVARMGGDEFTLLLPETDEKQAENAICKIRLLLDNAMKTNHWQVTFSMGVVSYYSPPVSVDEMLKKADALMYKAKKNGKNLINFENDSEELL